MNLGGVLRFCACGFSHVFRPPIICTAKKNRLEETSSIEILEAIQERVVSKGNNGTQKKFHVNDRK